MFRRVPRLYRRAILIYLAAIVLPACALVWLGLQSFERQRQALETLTDRQLASSLDESLLEAASEALDTEKHPVARQFFIFENGALIYPAMRAPLPASPPPAFADAERLEIDLARPDLALAAYRALLSSGQWNALAESRIARCLAKLGRAEEARTAWRKIATTYPDARDLSHRPFGVVAAIQAGETAGLYERITSGRWELSADQAEFFLASLDATRTSAYLDRFRVARAVEEGFRPAGTLRDGEIARFRLGTEDLFYRRDTSNPDRIVGLVAEPAWIEGTLRPAVANELGVGGRTGQELVVYGSAVGLVLLLLTSGVGLLVRDVTREARLNQLRADFVSGVTHELKTPLTLIRLYGETLLRHRRLPEPERREYVRIITRESTRLGRLIDQVLAVSRVDRSNEVYALEEGDLAPVVAGIVDDYGEWLEQAGFTVSRRLPESVPPVRFDAAALSQAIVNVLDNAAKYSGASREIDVRLGSGQGRVTLEVEDHGVGIPPADRDRVFERFYRASNGSGKGGYGLGLFMVRHIMQAHGGHAEVESERGKGSTFRLVFPVAPAARVERERSEPRNASERAWGPASTER